MSNINNGTNTVSKFAPGATTPSATLTGLSTPAALAFDSSGNLYVVNIGNNTVSKFAPGATTPTATLTGLMNPKALATDGSGNLYVVDYAYGAVVVFAPGSTTPSNAFTQLTGPNALAVDGSGNLYVSNFYAPSNGTVSKFAPGSTLTPAAGGVEIRSSVSSRPMSLGGTNNAVAGINLTDAELAQIQTTSAGAVTIGDSNQTGNITFTTATAATTAGAATVVLQSTSGAGQIILDDAGTGTGLNGNGGLVSLTPGTGGITAPNSAAGVPLATQGFNATGLTFNPTLTFAPTPTTQLTLINNTATPAAGNPITGAFSNLPQGGTCSINYLGTPYQFQVNYHGGDGNDLILTAIGPLTVQSTVVNGANGAGAQRSMVKSLVVTFSDVATLDVGAFAIINKATQATVGTVLVSADSTSGYTVATLTWSGSQTLYGSLVDGNYQLTIDATKVHDTALGTNLDGDHDGSPGGNYLFGTATVDNFFRLFGDADGSRRVDNTDFSYFASTMNKRSTDTGFLWYFDVNNSGRVDNTDFSAFAAQMNKRM